MQGLRGTACRPAPNRTRNLALTPGRVQTNKTCREYLNLCVKWRLVPQDALVSRFFHALTLTSFAGRALIAVRSVVGVALSYRGNFGHLPDNFLYVLYPVLRTERTVSHAQQRTPSVSSSLAWMSHMWSSAVNERARLSLFPSYCIIVTALCGIRRQPLQRNMLGATFSISCPCPRNMPDFYCYCTPQWLRVE